MRNYEVKTLKQETEEFNEELNKYVEKVMKASFAQIGMSIGDMDDDTAIMFKDMFKIMDKTCKLSAAWAAALDKVEAGNKRIEEKLDKIEQLLRKSKEA